MRCLTILPYPPVVDVTFSVCDIQERFRSTIHEYPKVYVSIDVTIRWLTNSDSIFRISTAQKMIKACKDPSLHNQYCNMIAHISHLGSILSIPIYATTQSAERLGPLCSELFPPSVTPTFQTDKTVFSMLVPDLHARMKADSSKPYRVALTGIEAHVCIFQTALDLVAQGHYVYVLADGVSSSHHAEAKLALDRLARAGVEVTTSEAWIYECMGDSSIDK